MAVAVEAALDEPPKNCEATSVLEDEVDDEVRADADGGGRLGFGIRRL